jgi:hypothetical protein
MAHLYICGYGVPSKSANLAPMYHILLRIYQENLAAKVGNFDEVHRFIVNLMVNSHKMKGTSVPLEVMDLSTMSCTLESLISSLVLMLRL